MFVVHVCNSVCCLPFKNEEEEEEWIARLVREIRQRRVSCCCSCCCLESSHVGGGGRIASLFGQSYLFVAQWPGKKCLQSMLDACGRWRQPFENDVGSFLPGMLMGSVAHVKVGHAYFFFFRQHSRQQREWGMDGHVDCLLSPQQASSRQAVSKQASRQSNR
jgi:hypothetical protein